MLSIGGRFTLLKAVLGSTTNYYMPIFKAPDKVLYLLEELRGRFFWGAEVGKRKLHWIAWNRALAIKDDGELIVDDIHGGVAGNFRFVNHFGGISSWVNLVRGMEKLKNKGVNLDQNCSIKVGNGQRTKFWADVWLGDKVFKESYPRLFALNHDPNAKVVDRCDVARELLAILRREWNKVNKLPNLSLCSNIEDLIMEKADPCWTKEEFDHEITENEYAIEGASIDRITTHLLQQLQNPSPSRGPRVQRRYIDRGRADAEQRLFRDYFAENPTYPEYKFRRRFRMRKSLFLKIVGDMEASHDYFKQRRNASGMLGFHPIQRCTAVLRMLAYGTHPDALDESIRMSARVARESLDIFCDFVLIMYKPRYGREPTRNDIRQLYAHHAQVHGFPGMLGSLDCMHWRWNGCPSAWHGQYTKGQYGYPTVVLQAAASQDMCSDFYTKIHNGTAPDSSFTLRGTQYRFGYYLVDGIYPERSIFVKTLAYPDDPQRQKYKRAQERARKDIERAFGVLKKRSDRIPILRYRSRSYDPIHDPTDLRSYCDPARFLEVMFTCMILHNMILEDEGHAICQYDENEIIPPPQPLPVASPEYLQRVQIVRSREIHGDLRRHLVDHLWTVDHLDLNMDPVDEYEDAYSDEDNV
ncbi:hypothetical protein LXL04_005541 [Taraxacum kok-saghyz]